MSATVVEQKNARAWATTVGTVTLTVRLRLISRQFKLFTPSANDAERNRRRGGGGETMGPFIGSKYLIKARAHSTLQADS